MLTVRNPMKPYITENCGTTDRDATFQIAPGAVLDIGIFPVAADCPSELSGPEFMEYFHSNLGRLNPLLRQVASDRDPVQALTFAALRYFSYRTGSAVVLPGITDQPSWGPSRLEAYALADLAVTGRDAWASFVATPPTVATIYSSVFATAQAGSANAATTDAVTEACQLVVNRAYDVATAIYGPAAVRPAARAALDPMWVAVSGEDDPAARPVNTFSLTFPQHDLLVTSSLADATVRFVVIPSTGVPDPPPAAPQTGGDDATPQLPASDPLTIPHGDQIVLFLPGLGSRAEECAHLYGPLQRDAAAMGHPVTVIAVDMPGQGYSSRIDPERISPWPADEASNFPILQFTEEFVIAFVDQLHQLVPIKDRISAVIGGSLSGNLVLRLGERDRSTTPWLQNLVAWSAAGVYDPVRGDPWKDEVSGVPKNAYIWSDAPILRQRFIDETLLSPYTRIAGVVPPHAGPGPTHWWRDGWEPCRTFAWQESFLNLVEIYGYLYKRWINRLQFEQLLFSHRSIGSDGRENYQRLTANLLLGAGEADRDPFLDIYSATSSLAPLLVNATGRTFLLEDTGHSIHDERPELLAREIVDFLPPLRSYGWMRCRKCGGLWLSYGGTSLCSVDAMPHVEDRGPQFAVLADETIPDGQDYWRCCKNCGLMYRSGPFWFPAQPHPGRRPKPRRTCAYQGKLEHDGSASPWYSIPTGRPPEAVEESGWRCCSKCSSLFVASPTSGQCPTDRGFHEAADGTYLLSRSQGSR